MSKQVIVRAREGTVVRLEDRTQVPNDRVVIVSLTRIVSRAILEGDLILFEDVPNEPEPPTTSEATESKRKK